MNSKSYTRRVTNTSAWLEGGLYPNGEATTCYWQYGATTSYGFRTRALGVGSGTDPVWYEA
ncbi:MAG TPA: hypothetical protein VG228_08235 [Solirubrobacteraceae bacterium]|nr:hypothetical protein [Solirubrobacteraceae bacterium]